MSRANRIGKELARQRAAVLRIERERRAARSRRNLGYGSSIGVVITATAQPAGPPLAPSRAVADTTGGAFATDAVAIPIGQDSAPVKLTVYEDARCSACGQFESKYQSAYKPLVKAGTVRLLVHPVDLIDQNSGGSGSLTGGNALACVQNAGGFEAYHDLLYAHQPAGSADDLGSTATLISYAKQISGLDSPAFESCVRSGKYDGWVKQNYRDLEQIDGVAGTSTPTLLANGTKLTLSTPAAFTAQLQHLAAQAAPSPAPSASASAPAPVTSSTASAGSSASPSPNAS